MTFSMRKAHCEALQDLRPGAEWTLYGNTYEGLIWLDKIQPKPTKLEFDTKKAEKADTISKL